MSTKARGAWRFGPGWLVAPLILFMLVFYALPLLAMLARSLIEPGWTWMVLLGRKGLINETLLALGLTDASLKLLNMPLAVHIAMIHIPLPYMILPLASVLGQIDQALPRAAASLRASPFAVFRRIVLPLSMPGVGAGVLLVFVLSLGFSITPALVALSLGATPWTTFWRVTLPLIRPGILVEALFAFITSFDELIVALFLSGSGAVTLPRRMWDDLRFPIDPTIAAVSTLTIVLTALLAWAARLSRRWEGGSGLG